MRSIMINYEDGEGRYHIGFLLNDDIDGVGWTTNSSFMGVIVSHWLIHGDVVVHYLNEYLPRRKEAK